LDQLTGHIVLSRLKSRRGADLFTAMLRHAWRLTVTGVVRMTSPATTRGLCSDFGPAALAADRESDAVDIGQVDTAVHAAAHHVELNDLLDEAGAVVQISGAVLTLSSPTDSRRSAWRFSSVESSFCCQSSMTEVSSMGT
jgi:hypothetical protein